MESDKCNTNMNVERVGETYELSFNPQTDILSVKFGKESANNDQIVEELSRLLEENFIVNLYGKVLRINGSQSLPVAYFISKRLAGVVKCIGVFDPKLNKYVVSVTTDKAYPIGMLLD